METLWSISMFFISPLLAYIVHIRSGYHKGGVQQPQKSADLPSIFAFDQCLHVFGFLCKRDRRVSF